MNLFLIIGAQRCGTTYLYKLLDEHPEVCMARPLRPEPKYFLKNNIELFDENNYLAEYYSECSDDVVYGEKSTSYIEFPELLMDLSESIPNIKLICSIRNPVDRALSNYYFSANNGLEKRSLLEVFIENVPPVEGALDISVDPFNYLGRGEYVKYLRALRSIYDNGKLYLVNFDDMIASMDSVRSLYRWLGVSQDCSPQTFGDRVHASVKNDQVTPVEVLDLLYAYYRPFNEQLSDEFNVDVSRWSQL